MSNETLPPCPFCGDKPYHSGRCELGNRNTWCENPICQISGLRFNITEWNHRPTEDALVEALETIGNLDDYCDHEPEDAEFCTRCIARRALADAKGE